MHELSIAQSLLDIVLEEAANHGASRVHKVGIKLGDLSNVVASALEFSFDLIKENTPAAGAVLEIKKVPALGACTGCGRELDMSEPVFACPHCGATKLEMTQGRELFVDYIEAD